MTNLITKKLLVVGSGIFSIPLIQKAKELGHFVIAVHHEENNLGFSHSHKNYICDANDLDKLLKIAKDENIDGIATISEYAAISVAFVARELSLPGYDYESATILSNKYLLRQLQEELKIDQPQFGLANTIEEARSLFEKLNKPIMVKPINSCGSRGVFKAYNWKEVAASLSIASSHNFKQSGVIMEEYLEGIELGGGVMFRDYEVFVFGITSKFVDENYIPYTNTLPCPIAEKDKQAIITLLNKISRKLKIKNAYLNVNMILTDHGPRILELGGRLAGNSSPEITRLAYGVDPYEYTINFSLGIEKSYTCTEPSDFYAASIIGSKKTGVVKKIFSFEELLPENSHQLMKDFWKCKPEDRVKKMENTDSILGFFLFKETKYENILKLSEKIQQLNWIDVE